DAVRRLRGGSASAVHALAVVDAAGRRHALVLRRYLRTDWLAEEPALAEKEARVLRALAATDLPAPRVLAHDADGARAGAPAVLMERMRGRIDLSAERLESGIPAMAGLLARIHALACEPLPRLQPYRAWHDPETARPPAWTRTPEAWQRLVRADRAPLPPHEPVLLHRDYHPGNVL
ncbi:MAG: aminoglycoside phosphotransferase family protein, partial [Chloroflexi bacterium]|nr:aminoglycoside phosphotransferase family protein [Chloroflexota bacterium]